MTDFTRHATPLILEVESPLSNINATYTLASNLSDYHRQMLEMESAIAPGVIESRGYFTAKDPRQLADLGFAEHQRRVPALVIPVYDVYGNQLIHRIRPDNPRPSSEKPGKFVKYEQPANTEIILDVPPASQEALNDPKERLWIVEGEKKADALISQGECAIALLGVWAWKRDGYPLPDWDQIPMIGREVCILFDSDTADKVEVRHAIYSLSRFIRGKVHGS